MQEDRLKEIYTPSGATHQDAAENEEKRLDNRSAGVWLVTIYCLISGVGGPLVFIFGAHYLAMINNGEISVLQGLVMLLPFPLILIGGIQLFRLRKSAVAWFVAAAIIRAPSLVSSHGLSFPWWLIFVALAVYALVLRRRKVLD